MIDPIPYLKQVIFGESISQGLFVSALLTSGLALVYLNMASYDEENMG